MTKLRIIFLLLTIVSLSTGFILLPEEKIDERAYLKEVAPDIAFSEKSGAPQHYRAENGIIAFNTYDIVPSIRGYAGPIKLLIALNTKSEITGLKILAHRETKNYIHYMVSTAYLSQFIGKNANDPFEIDRDIDGISRATESVKALTKTVRESSQKAASRVYGLDIKRGERKKQFSGGWIVYLLLYISAISFYFVTRNEGKFLKIRDICLILGIIIIGIYLSTPFSILHIFNLILLRLSSSVIWYVIVGSVLLSLALAGRFYCGWLCPFGALAEFIGRMPLNKWGFSVETDDRWRRLKYYLLFLFTAVVFAGRHTEYGNYETYITLFSLHGNVLTWSLVALMLIINVRVERFWCRYLCPVAALTGLFSRKDSGYVSRKDCPMNNKPNPLISECIRCNRCYSKKRVK